MSLERFLAAPDELSKWDKRFLEVAKLISSWSKDPRGGVGAVIVSSENRIIATGFNGLPRRFDDTQTEMYGRRFVIHAEENAIFFAHRSLQGCAIYTYPLSPCLSCAARIMQAGITKVVSGLDFNHGTYLDQPDSFRDSLSLLALEGISVVVAKTEE